MNDQIKLPAPATAKKPSGNGDPVQRAQREERIKQALKENLKRRKQKARAITQKASSQVSENENGGG